MSKTSGTILLALAAIIYTGFLIPASVGAQLKTQLACIGTQGLFTLGVCVGYSLTWGDVLVIFLLVFGLASFFQRQSTVVYRRVRGRG